MRSKMWDFFSVSVDSLPDVSHVDQLTVILRYVLPSRPVEHFMTFINITSHTGEKLASYLLDFLTENGIDISLCRGQSYDNASNLSGKYSGIQAKIKERNVLVDYIPCAARSLNLVCQSAVDCCVKAVSFFWICQEFYNFFSASTSHWMILRDSLPKGCPVPKLLSGTRWSANAEAVNAVVLGYPIILEALESIKDDESQKSATKKDAKILSDAMHTLETGILCEVWNDLLQPFSRCSLRLQSTQIDLSTAVNLIRSLGTVLPQMQDSFDEYEIQGAVRTANHEYKSAKHHKR
ncbi:unnamed protein product [Natator depressus]